MWDIRKTIFQNLWNRKFILIEDKRENQKLINAIIDEAEYLQMDCEPHRGDDSISITVTDMQGNRDTGNFFGLAEMKRVEDVRNDINYCIIGDLNYE